MDVEVIGVHKQYSGGSAAALNGISFVAESGSGHAVVVDASPKGTFDDAAIKAILRWKYNPKIEGAQAVARKGVQTILRFQLED